MEAAELGILMLSIGIFGTFLYSDASPLSRFDWPPYTEAFCMGAAVALATYLVIRSPFGRRSGAHINPAVTMAYLWLGRIHRWDALFYVVAQFAGGAAGVLLAHEILGSRLSAFPVRYVVTVPGSYGWAIAFMAELLLSALLMTVVLFSTNHRKFAKFSPLFVAFITVFYFLLCSSISGFSANPARSFSSALFARIWAGIWIYFAAPCLGMYGAAFLYVRMKGMDKVYCAKVFHDSSSICPFPCRFESMMSEDRPSEKSSTYGYGKIIKPRPAGPAIWEFWRRNL